LFVIVWYELVDIELLRTPYGPSVLEKATCRYISKCRPL